MGSRPVEATVSAASSDARNRISSAAAPGCRALVSTPAEKTVTCCTSAGRGANEVGAGDADDFANLLKADLRLPASHHRGNALTQNAAAFFASPPARSRAV